MKQKLPYIFLFIQVLLFGGNARGQAIPYCNNGGGAFSVNPPIGCVGETIKINNEVVGAESVTYAFNFNRTQIDPPDKKDITTDPSYVYNTAGTFTILQYGSKVSGFTTCKDYVVKETRALSGSLVACEDGLVRLTIPNDSITRAYDKVEINWGDGNTESWNVPSDKDLILPHRYQGSIPSIKITGKHTSGSCQGVTKSTLISGAVTPPSLSKIRILSVEMQLGGSAKLIYEGMDGIFTQVLVDKGDGNFIDTQKGTSTGGSQSVIIPSLDVQIVYKFKLSSRNVCDNLVESKVVTSVVVKPDVILRDEINALIWKPYPTASGLIEYQIQRDEIILLSTQNTTYLDADVKCGHIYKYEVVAIIEGDVRSYSAPIEVEPKTTMPDIISTASVSVSGDNLIETKVEIAGDGLTSSYDLVIERSISGSSLWDKVSGIGNQSLTFQDKDVSTAESSYCYRFSYVNACKLSSPSPSQSVCSILLKGDATNVVWTSDSPFSGGTASFDLIQMDKAGNVTGETPKGLSTSQPVVLEDEITSLYQIKAFSTSGNLVSYSNKLNFIKDAIVQIPDVFTPNNDFINDIFIVKSYFTNSFRLSIFNRWGVLIFRSNNSAEGWNGNDDKGVPLSAGYYVYKVDIEDTRGKSVSRNGGFLLIR